MSTKNKFMQYFTEACLFFSKFFTHPLRNASIIPSSTTACQKMIANIDFSKVEVLVELGPGNGNCTEQIIAQCKPTTKIILVEIDKTYADLLQRKYGQRVIIENTSAHLLDDILQKYQISKVDVLISGLPFLYGPIREQLFTTIKNLTDQGTIFRFFTYMPPIMKKVYKSLHVQKRYFVLKNIPPLWVYGIN